MRLGRGRVVVALVCVAALLGATSRQVSAHAELEASAPAANSVLEVGPAAIVLDFDEAIETPLTSLLSQRQMFFRQNS